MGGGAVEEDGQTPEPLGGGEVVYKHRGPIYNRPIGRGITLLDTEPVLSLEDVVDAGYYTLEVVIRKLPASYKLPW